MTIQDLLFPLNANINLAVLVLVAFTVGACAFLAGRLRHACHARTEVHDALERAARDIRLYAANQKGSAIGPFAERALKEAEYIVLYRSLGVHYRLKPTGDSRLRPPEVPRSRRYQEIQARQELRELIRTAAGTGNAADNTYAGNVANAVHRRYSPNSSVLIAASTRRRRR